jgi:hypothetical protein
VPLALRLDLQSPVRQHASKEEQIASKESDNMAAPGPTVPTEVIEKPVENPFTEAQWTTLMSIMDTIIPSIQIDTNTNQTDHQSIPQKEFEAAVDSLKKTVDEKRDTRIFEEYLNKKASDEPKFQNTLKHAFGKLLPEANRKGMAFILSTLE